MTPSVTAVMLGYGPEQWLGDAVRSVLASREVDVDVVLVDNGCTSPELPALGELPGVRLVSPGTNTGFAGGCNVGAAAAGGQWLAFVNSDAVVEPGALARLVEVAQRADVGIATASVRLADDRCTINSAGNPVHVLGLVWAGGHGDPAHDHGVSGPVAAASGAGLVLSRQLWRDLGGFAPEYFAYHEDTELSLRCWQRGLSVQYVVEAVVLHHYEFSRNPTKLYLLERNRLLLLLTLYERRTLLLLAPLLLAFELAMLLNALAGGWARQKLAGWWWLVRHRRWVRARRALLQCERTVGDRQLAGLLTPRLEAGNIELPRGAGLLDAVVVSYWRCSRPLLRR